MASNELKEIRKNMTKESIREHQLSKVGGTETDMFSCGKCKGKNCSYTQVPGPRILRPYQWWLSTVLLPCPTVESVQRRRS